MEYMQTRFKKVIDCAQDIVSWKSPVQSLIIAVTANRHRNLRGCPVLQAAICVVESQGQLAAYGEHADTL